jgi:hypothetical protein
LLRGFCPHNGKCLTVIIPIAARVQDDSFRRAVEVLGPRQATTAGVLRLLDVILRMLHGDRMAGTRSASRSSDDESRRETARGAGRGFRFRR